VLLGLIRTGDPEALAALYERYARQVSSLTLAILRDPGKAEEATQETFFRVWQRADSFDATRGRLATWLLSIAHHRAIDTLRHTRRIHRREEPWDNQLGALLFSSNGPGPEEATALIEEGRRVGEARKRLPQEQQQVLGLSYFKGLTQVEISQRLQQPLGTVKTRMRLGIQKLRQSLEPWLKAEE
jgi:RNA polymerase sigma-70 factor (ECF subfamily)